MWSVFIALAIARVKPFICTMPMRLDEGPGTVVCGSASAATELSCRVWKFGRIVT